jgi:hypothetical protein
MGAAGLPVTTYSPHVLSDEQYVVLEQPAGDHLATAALLKCGQYVDRSEHAAQSEWADHIVEATHPARPHS